MPTRHYYKTYKIIIYTCENLNASKNYSIEINIEKALLLKPKTQDQN